MVLNILPSFCFGKQFELVAEINHWSPQQKALSLVTSLRGTAQSILGELDVLNRCEYQSLVSILHKRFGSQHPEETSRAILRNRVKQPQESLYEFAQEIRQLVRSAYPAAEYKLQDKIAKYHFIDGLPNTEDQRQVFQTRPRNLEESVKTANDLEAFHQHDQAEHHFKRQKKTTRVDTTNEETLHNGEKKHRSPATQKRDIIRLEAWRTRQNQSN